MIVELQNMIIPELTLQNKKILSKVQVAYETYGTLSPKKDNAILIIHALTGTAHCSGKNAQNDDKVGWWDDMIGPGKYIDTNKYFVVCSNCLGGCSGTTGPRSINPNTGKRYNLLFPEITFADQVEVQKNLMDHLEIKKWLSIVGGSMGGMNALEWSLRYPDLVKSVIPLATTAQASSQSIAFSWVGREAIISDPNWSNGNYEQVIPEKGLSIARMLAHITYLSDVGMDQKFGRNLQNKTKGATFSSNFAVESYLKYQGERFVERFDANCYLYLTRMLDYFNLADHGDGNLNVAMQKANADFLIFSFSSDWLFTTKESLQVVNALKKAGRNVTFAEIQSDYGHDAFLLEFEAIGPMIADFLDCQYLQQ